MTKKPNTLSLSLELVPGKRRGPNRGSARVTKFELRIYDAEAREEVVIKLDGVAPLTVGLAHVGRCLGGAS